MYLCVCVCVCVCVCACIGFCLSLSPLSLPSFSLFHFSFSPSYLLSVLSSFLCTSTPILDPLSNHFLIHSFSFSLSSSLHPQVSLSLCPPSSFNFLSPISLPFLTSLCLPLLSPPSACFPNLHSLISSGSAHSYCCMQRQQKTFCSLRRHNHLFLNGTHVSFSGGTSTAILVTLASLSPRRCTCPARLKHHEDPEPHHVGPEPHQLGPEPHHVGPEPHHVGPEPHQLGPEPHHVGPEPHHVTTVLQPPALMRCLGRKWLPQPMRELLLRANQRPSLCSLRIMYKSKSEERETEGEGGHERECERVRERT